MSNASSPKNRVAFLGKTGSDSTFGAKAARHFFDQGTGWDLIGKEDHTDVLDALWTGDAEYGVVAIENAVDGVVNETARGVAQLTARGIHVLGEVVLPVSFFFAARAPLDLTRDVKVYAHSTAKGQCLVLKRRLRRMMRGEAKVVFVNADSNGVAARSAADPANGNCAAIVNWEGLTGSGGLRLVKITAEQLSNEWIPDDPVLPLQDPNPGNAADAEMFRVGDFKNSTTRFWKLGHGQFPPAIEQPEYRKRYNRTSILMNLDHDSPGGLMETLEHFSRRKCNLSIAYPVPIPGRPFEYSFMLEFEDAWKRNDTTMVTTMVAGGHIDHPDGKLRAAYEELLNSGISLNPPIIFGAYPTEILGAYPVTMLPAQ